MNTITREKAIRMIYCEPYSKARAIDLLNGIENIGLDVCYKDDPTTPSLLCTKSIDQNPYKNKRYKNESTTNEIIYLEDEIHIRKCLNQTQLVEFLNTKYLPFDVDYNDLYEPKSLPSGEIFSDVLKITNVLDNKSVNGFTKWCSNKKLKPIEATSKRRMNEAGQKVATRLLYTLKNKFIGKNHFSIMRMYLYYIYICSKNIILF
ncbi:hypothetical protein EDC94DRAFT_530520 [Helicostylum pulchrum]|nr:hypothetical protein EDC94DRAFT_530520 [Helicostylum pulchrum]